MRVFWPKQAITQSVFFRIYKNKIRNRFSNTLLHSDARCVIFLYNDIHYGEDIIISKFVSILVSIPIFGKSGLCLPKMFGARISMVVCSLFGYYILVVNAFLPRINLGFSQDFSKVLKGVIIKQTFFSHFCSSYIRI